jgi:hypothetical protein
MGMHHIDATVTYCPAEFEDRNRIKLRNRRAAHDRQVQVGSPGCEGFIGARRQQRTMTLAAKGIGQPKRLTFAAAPATLGVDVKNRQRMIRNCHDNYRRGLRLTRGHSFAYFRKA